MTPTWLKTKKAKQLIQPWSQCLQIDRQAGWWNVTHTHGKIKTNIPTLHLNLGSDFIPFHVVLFLLTSSFLMSVFIVHVTVWRCLPSDRFLYTPLHISEPTPSVLILSASSLTQTVAESMSIQFAKHFKWYVAALHYCSIFPSQWGRLLFSSDAHSTFSHVSYSFLYLLVLSGCILMKHSLKGNAYVCMKPLGF